jgi:hypothetical protein
MADLAEEPLIGNEEGSYRNPDESPGLFVWLLTFSAGISGLLFGCKSS